ncbi:MAG: hypothetical protein MI810_17675 [Flavobacteriales bacterium]|nr:hypothetical protein [Flavobacteriales bacterium]
MNSFFTKLLAFFLCTSFQAIAQDNTLIKNDFRLSTGYENFRILDLNASPLLYSSNNLLVGLDFERNKKRYLWSLNGELSVGNSQSKKHGVRTAVFPDKPNLYGEADTTEYELNPFLSFVRFTFNFSALKQIGHSGFFVGGKIGNHFNFSGLGADSWFFNQLSLQAAVRYQKEIGINSKISAELSTSAFSYLLRQPYTLDPSLPDIGYFKAYLQTGSFFASPNDFQHFNFNLSYQYSLKNSKNKIGLQYQFMWMNHSFLENRNLSAYSNSLSLTYTL